MPSGRCRDERSPGGRERRPPLRPACRALGRVDHGRAHVRVVEDLDRGGHGPERDVAERRLDRLGRVLVPARLALEVDVRDRRLQVSRHVDDLLETRHAERDVLGRHTSKMKRVERHHPPSSKHFQCIVSWMTCRPSSQIRNRHGQETKSCPESLLQVP